MFSDLDLPSRAHPGSARGDRVRRTEDAFSRGFRSGDDAFNAGSYFD